ncbi:MAG: AIR synthase [Fluviicola sp.]|nr:MAG: AIR synthase [Fluviicola sp.]
MSDEVGKFSSETMKNTVLQKLGAKRDEVIVNAAYGTDTAVIQINEDLGMVVSSDPITLIPGLGMRESALLSVYLTANDLATSGFAPQYAQFVLNLPVHLSKEDFQVYWDYIHEFCKDLGVAITGGHTGKIPGQESTVPGSATMFLTAPKDEILTAQGAEAGDQLIMTKVGALSSTSILAKSFPETVKKELGEELYEKAVSNFENISVVQDALIASRTLKKNVELMAMHDVTEGGILGAAMEMATASGCGIEINSDKIIVGEEQLRIAALFNLDYREIIGSGSMLIAVKPNHVSKLITALEKEGISASNIGAFTNEKDHFLMNENGKLKKLIHNEQDPYWAAFFNAFQKGLK